MTSRTLPVGADRVEERERLVIAAEQHVLAVVDELAGLAIGERRGPAAELRPRVERRARGWPACGERRRAQPGEAGADDDDVGGVIVGAARGRGYPARRSVRIQVVAAISARRGRGMRTTSENTS